MFYWIALSHKPWSRRTRPAYLYDRNRMPPTYVSGSVIGIPPVKPCRRRRPFSRQVRVNRFVLLDHPVHQPRNHFGIRASPQSLLHAGCVTLPVDGRSPPLGLMSPCSRDRQISTFTFLFCIPVYAHPTGAKRTVGDIRYSDRVWSRHIEFSVGLVVDGDGSPPPSMPGRRLLPICALIPATRVTPRLGLGSTSHPDRGDCGEACDTLPKSAMCVGKVLPGHYVIGLAERLFDRSAIALTYRARQG